MTRLQLATEADGPLIARSLRDPAAFAAVFDRHWPSDPPLLHEPGGRGRGGPRGRGLPHRVRRAPHVRRSDYDDAGPWLYGVATNVLRRWFRCAERSRRATSRRGRSTSRIPTDDALGRVEAEALGPRLAAALRALAARDRDTLLLYAWAGLTYEEVAPGHRRLRRHRPLAHPPRPRPACAPTSNPSREEAT